MAFELLTPAEMAIADAASGNIPMLMQAAGRAAARAIRRHYAPCRTLFLIGPGHNGGDGLVAAEQLRLAGWPVIIRRYQDAAPEETARADLVIDAVFGAGLSRDLPATLIPIFQAARRIAAIDVPSGLDGANGQIRGFAPQAERTFTFFRAKPGHYLYPGRGLCGALEVLDIGMDPALLVPIRPRCWVNDPSLWTLPARQTTGHKYSHGEVTVLAGELPGAARLACAAARRAGAGMVTLAAATPLLLPEAGLIVRAEPFSSLIADPRRLVWLCGPGLGPTAGEKLAALIAHGGKTIIADADALTACAGAPAKLQGAAMITPHEAEFTRVFGPIGPSKLAAARNAAAATGAVVLLKGADTVIAAPGGRAIINANAPPWLATGGTGDVLAGLIAALLAQGMPSFEAACAAAWLHGAAAQNIGPGLIAEDIPAQLPAIMQRLRAGS